MRSLLLLCLFVALPTLVSAQTVINPTKVEFTASPDHAATFLGVELVDSYRLTYRDGVAVVAVQDAGKPTPNASNVITVTPIPAAVIALKNKSVTVTVEVVGATAGLISDPEVSDFFGYVGKPRPSGKPSPKP